MNEWMTDGMNEWMNEWTNEWMNDWMFEWLNDWMNEWIEWNGMEWNGMEWIDWMNEWMNERLNEWTTEWMNDWLNEWMNERTNERTNERMNEWMNEMERWASYFSLLTYFFPGRPLPSGTSSLSYFCSERHLFGVLLLWAASQLALWRLLQPNSSFREALPSVLRPPAGIPHGTRVALWSRTAWLPFAQLTMCLATSTCNPACRAQPCQCVLSQPVANAHSRSVTPNWPPFAKRWQWGRFRAALNMQVFYDFCMKWSSRGSLVRILPTSSSKSAPRLSMFVFKCTSRSRYSPASILFDIFLDRATNPRKQRPYFGDLRSHISRKNTGCRTWEVSTHEFTRFQAVTLLNCLMMGGWHDDGVDMKVEISNDDHRPQLGNFLATLPLITCSTLY